MPSERRLRQGHHEPRNLWRYPADVAPESKSGECAGQVFSADLAAEIVDAFNTLPEALAVLRDLTDAYSSDTKGSINENRPRLGARVAELLGCVECGEKPSTHCGHCGACPCHCGGPDE